MSDFIKPNMLNMITHYLNLLKPKFSAFEALKLILVMTIISKNNDILMVKVRLFIENEF